jgi:serine/threonine-protein kinase
MMRTTTRLAVFLAVTGMVAGGCATSVAPSRDPLVTGGAASSSPAVMAGSASVPPGTAAETDTAAVSPAAAASPVGSQRPSQPQVTLLPADDPVAATTYSPGALAIDPAGNLYLGDCGAARIVHVEDEDTVAVVAGSGPGGFDAGFEGDGGPATEAQFQCTYGLAFDASGNLAFSDHGNSRVRLIGRDGTITTIAGYSHPGSGWGGYGGDGGPATMAQLNNPTAIAFGPDGTLYIADRDNDRIRAVTPDGRMSTVAGTTGGFAGDGGPATAARLDDPAGISVAADGTIYFADSNNERVRKIATDGTITTVAGDGRKASKGDNGPATEASLADPEGVLVDGGGDVFVAEGEGDRVRVITSDGTIWAYAGTGEPGNGGDGGRAEEATLSDVDNPGGLAMDDQWNLYISSGDRIRVVDPAGRISTAMVGHG